MMLVVDDAEKRLVMAVVRWRGRPAAAAGLVGIVLALLLAVAPGTTAAAPLLPHDGLETTNTGSSSQQKPLQHGADGVRERTVFEQPATILRGSGNRLQRRRIQSISADANDDLNAAARARATEPSVTCVALISSGRAGTTKMMGDLSGLSDVFPIQEPYHQSNEPNSVIPPPTYGELFSCNAFKVNPLAVLWSYSCNNTPQFEPYRSECLHTPRKFGAKAYELCKESRIRVVKTIRFPHYPDLEFPRASCAHNRVIHNLRAPWPLGLSIFNIGWGIKDLEAAYDEDQGTFPSNNAIMTMLAKIVTLRCEAVNKEFDLVKQHRRTLDAEFLFLLHSEDHAQSLPNARAALRFIYSGIMGEREGGSWETGPFMALEQHFIRHVTKRQLVHFADFGSPGRKYIQRLGDHELEEVRMATMEDDRCRRVLAELEQRQRHPPTTFSNNKDPRP